MFLTCIHLDRKKRKFIKKIYITYIFLIFLHILQKIVVKELLQNGEIVFLISHFLANLTSKKLQTYFFFLKIHTKFYNKIIHLSYTIKLQILQINNNGNCSTVGNSD